MPIYTLLWTDICLLRAAFLGRVLAVLLKYTRICAFNLPGLSNLLPETKTFKNKREQNQENGDTQRSTYTVSK